ncbi:MAG: hypothetical protein WDN69_17575 [Aliidongia sp.]
MLGTGGPPGELAGQIVDAGIVADQPGEAKFGFDLFETPQQLRRADQIEAAFIANRR